MNSKPKKINNRVMALSAIFIALAMVFMYLASIIQTIDLSILVFISLFTGVLVWEGERLAAIIMFVAIGLLSFFLIPNKFLPLGYIVFFGWYGLFNGVLTGKVNKWIRLLICLLAFNLVLIISLVFYETFLGIIPFKIWTAFLVAEPMFLLYFFVYDMLLVYYNRRLRKYFFGGKR